MTTGAVGLNQIVVVGYGTQEKGEITGSVSSVKGEDVQNLPVAGASQALQGRAAGVQVVRNGGAPGDGGSIRIRGTGTVNNADPLIVIDGVPSGGINDINPNDIESIEVLKDASTSAIYGLRAANGVVLITTKRGKFNENIQVSLNAYAGSSSPINTIDVLDAPTLAQLKRERYLNDGLEINPIWEDPQYQTQLTDWQDELLGTGLAQNYDFTLRGGGQRSAFALSGGFFQDEGMMKNSFFERYYFRINSDHKIGSVFKLGQNLQLTRQRGNFLTNQTDWTNIHGTFIAEGGEEYLLLGSFTDDENQNRQLINIAEEPKVYYYIDDVRVEPCGPPGPFILDRDTVLCTGEEIELTGLPGALSYEWQDGSTAFQKRVSRAGEYRVVSRQFCNETEINYKVTLKECACTGKVSSPQLIASSHTGNLSFILSDQVTAVSLTLWDAAGRKAGTFSGDQFLNLPTGFLAAGAYFWTMELQCVDGQGDLMSRTKSGKLVLLR